MLFNIISSFLVYVFPFNFKNDKIRKYGYEIYISNNSRIKKYIVFDKKKKKKWNTARERERERLIEIVVRGEVNANKKFNISIMAIIYFPNNLFSDMLGISIIQKKKMITFSHIDTMSWMLQLAQASI